MRSAQPLRTRQFGWVVPAINASTAALPCCCRATKVLLRTCQSDAPNDSIWSPKSGCCMDLSPHDNSRYAGEQLTYVALIDEMNFFAVEPSAVHRLGPATLGPRPSDRRTYQSRRCPAG